MTAHLERFGDVPVDQLLKMFWQLRTQNIHALGELAPSAGDLTRIAIHPKVGRVSLVNVLSTWVAHDLIHIGQISRVMAKQYKANIGPFLEFLPRLK